MVYSETPLTKDKCRTDADCITTIEILDLECVLCHVTGVQNENKNAVILSCYGHEIKQPIKFLVLRRTTDLIGPLIW